MNGDLSMPSFGQQMLNTHPYPLIMAPVMNFEVKVKQEIKVGGGDSTARASILGPFEEGMHQGDVKGIVVEHGLPFVADAGGPRWVRCSSFKNAFHFLTSKPVSFATPKKPQENTTCFTGPSMPIRYPTNAGGRQLCFA